MRALAYHHPRNADQLLLSTGEVAAEEVFLPAICNRSSVSQMIDCRSLLVTSRFESGSSWFPKNCLNDRAAVSFEKRNQSCDCARWRTSSRAVRGLHVVEMIFAASRLLVKAQNVKSNVDLPTPNGPMIGTNPQGRISRSIPPTTGTSS